MNQNQHLNQTVHISVLYSGWQYDDMGKFGFASSGLQTNLNLILSFCWNLLTLGSDWWGSRCILVSLPARVGLDQTCNRQGQAQNSDIWTKYGLSGTCLYLSDSIFDYVLLEHDGPTHVLPHAVYLEWLGTPSWHSGILRADISSKITGWVLGWWVVHKTSSEAKVLFRLGLGFGLINFCRIRHWAFLDFLDLNSAMAFGIWTWALTLKWSLVP